MSGTMEDGKYPILGVVIVLLTLIKVYYAHQGNNHHDGISPSREYLLTLSNRVHHDSNI